MKTSTSYVRLAAIALAAATAAAAAAQTAPARTIDIAAADFKFVPEVIQVTAGETVVLRARSTDGKGHGLAIKELKVKAALPKTGEVVPIEITAGKPGTYTIACSVYCGSGHSRMRARLVVTEAK
jgi:cytochrome c oxidase subunit 2